MVDQQHIEDDEEIDKSDKEIIREAKVIVSMSEMKHLRLQLTIITQRHSVYYHT